MSLVSPLLGGLFFRSVRLLGGVEICFQARQRRWVPGREVWRGEADSIGEIHINFVLGMDASCDCALAAVQGNVHGVVTILRGC